MTGPKCDSDYRGGIKFCDESGVRLEFDDITRITEIPHGNKFFSRYSCCLSLPKRFPQVAQENRNLPVKFSTDQNHSGDPAVSGDRADESLWAIIN